MLKKTIPFIFLSALLLGACTNGDDDVDVVPNNDDAPMDNIEDRERNWTPEMEDERRGGNDLDGIETDENRDDGGILNDENGDMNNDRNDPLLDDDDEQDLNNR